MRFQSTDHNCGPAALANALKALDANVTEQQIEKVIANAFRKGDLKSVDGTNQQQIKKALELMKYGWEEFSLAHTEASWRALRSYLSDGYPVLICVDDNEHWVAAIGVIGDKVLVADAADSELVLSYGKEKLLKRWGYQSDVVTYYGLPIVPKKTRGKKKVEEQQ